MKNTLARRKVALTLVSGMLLALFVGMFAAPVSAITWGEPDTEHPNVGAMVVGWPGYGLYQVCSGTLIHPRVFLTAGHCTEGWDGAEVEYLWVNFDQNAVNENTLVAVEEVITHPDYYWGPQSNPHDVGVLILAEPVTDVPVANLPSEGFLDELREGRKLNRGRAKAKFTMVGYGVAIEWPPPEFVYNEQRQFAVSEYRALLKAWLRVSQNHAAGDGGTCYGDSGGPAFWTGPDGTEILVGITSWGDVPCVASDFSYRVDIPETLSFIESVISELE